MEVKVKADKVQISTVNKEVSTVKDKEVSTDKVPVSTVRDKEASTDKTPDNTVNDKEASTNKTPVNTVRDKEVNTDKVPVNTVNDKEASTNKVPDNTDKVTAASTDKILVSMDKVTGSMVKDKEVNTDKGIKAVTDKVREAGVQVTREAMVVMVLNNIIREVAREDMEWDKTTMVSMEMETEADKIMVEVTLTKAAADPVLQEWVPVSTASKIIHVAVNHPEVTAVIAATTADWETAA
jgi:hypothetical protein